MSSQFPNNRRHFLKGSAYTLMLPFMESLAPKGITAAMAATVPTNFVTFYWGNGAYTNDGFLYPTGGTEKSWNLTKGLARMTEHKNDLIIFQGLTAAAIGGDAHDKDSQAFLCGPPSGNRSSLDQIHADKVNAPFRSIYAQLQQSPKGDTFGSLSFKNGAHVNPATTSKDLFQRIFINGPGGQVSSSTTDPAAAKIKAMKSKVLDNLVEDVKYYKANKLGAADQIRLDEYLTSVEEIQKNITTDYNFDACTKPAAANFAADANPQQEGIAEKRMAAYIDIIATAMQCGITHTASLMMWGCSTSAIRTNRDLKSLTVSCGETETHSASHATGSAHMAMTEWTQWQAAQFLSRAKRTSTATGTLFDSMLFMWGGTTAQMGHSKKNCPIFISGRANGKLNPYLGSHYKYPVHYQENSSQGGDFEKYYPDETPRENVLQGVADLLELNYSVPFPGSNQGRRVKVFG